MDPATANHVASLLEMDSYRRFVRFWPEWWFDPLEQKARLEWLRDLGSCYLWPRTEVSAKWSECYKFRMSCYNGHLNLLKWLHREFPHPREEAKADNCYAFRWAAFRGHLEVLRWLQQEFPHTKQEAQFVFNLVCLNEIEQRRHQVLRWIQVTFDLE